MKLSLVLLCACVQLPHVSPRPRSQAQVAATLVAVLSSCSEPYPFRSGDPTDPRWLEPDVEWFPPNAAAGVIVSERHVVTVAHAVRCPLLPDVRVYLQDGRVLRVAVEQDDQAFPASQPTDVARLVISSAENFGLLVPPPQLAKAEGPAWLETPRGAYHGTLGLSLVRDQEGRERQMPTLDVESYLGASGSPAYSETGELLGIQSLLGPGETILEPSEPWWLLGT